MKIDIHQNSGFCFGVRSAISKVEDLLSKGQDLYCLGEIVHNREEVDRLADLGMKTIVIEEIKTVEQKTVLIRSHGEPPSSYTQLTQQNNTIIDATCPVVLKLQKRIKQSFEKLSKENGQLVIFGKQGHPEVLGLNGQTDNQSIVVSTLDDLAQIDFTRPIEVYSQTTMPLDAFHQITQAIEKRAENAKVIIHDTICRQVANRVPQLKEFSAEHDVILFVSGKNSSNGKLLYEVCKNINSKSHFIATSDEIDSHWFTNIDSIGICGATSTPQWLMEEIQLHVKLILNIDQQ
jgi:4-hydroxy-3-methylbut-2-enyl diphosphate reductase